MNGTSQEVDFMLRLVALLAVSVSFVWAIYWCSCTVDSLLGHAGRKAQALFGFTIGLAAVCQFMLILIPGLGDWAGPGWFFVLNVLAPLALLGLFCAAMRELFLGVELARKRLGRAEPSNDSVSLLERIDVVTKFLKEVD